MKKLAGKVAVITGASSGIGMAIANRLAGDGVTVYDISLKTSENKNVKKCYEGDVNDTERVAQILEEIVAVEGKIDIFINNAGFGIAGAIEHTNYKNIYKQIDTNLSAVIALSGQAIKYLKESKGRLINISSVGGIIPLPYQATYSASKAGVEIFSRALANELRPYGVKVCAVLPGDTKTGFTAARVIDNEVEDKKEQADIRISIAKMEKDEEHGMTPDRVAKVVEKVLRQKRPPLRKTVGAGYKFIVFLPRIVSTRFANFVVRLLYCKKSKQ